MGIKGQALNLDPKMEVNKMAETRITLEETNDFATALRVRRLAIGMDLPTLRGFLDRVQNALLYHAKSVRDFC